MSTSVRQHGVELLKTLLVECLIKVLGPIVGAIAIKIAVIVTIVVVVGGALCFAALYFIATVVGHMFS